MASASKLEDLIALAREPSSARRRELLREVTNLFFNADGAHGARELALFDGVLSTLAQEMEEEVRAELAERFGAETAGPQGLIRKLALDEAARVATPVLSRSDAISDADLLDVARTRGQAHLRAISERPSVPEAVSEVVVARGDDTTVGVLLRNPGASLSRRSAETVVDRAVRNVALHAAVIERQSLPVDLLNEMYFVVEARLREQIMARNAAMDPVALEEALATGRERVASRDGLLPKDYAEADAHVQALRRTGALTPATLAGFLRAGERTRFLAALSKLAEVDFHTARWIVERKELDALAILCKAADFDRSLFLTFALLILAEPQGMTRAETYGRLYQELSRDTALRTIRFWRMRRATGDTAAA